MRLLLSALLLLGTMAHAADLSQVRHQHAGPCDTTPYHIVPFFTNTTGGPLRVTEGMLLNGGTGAQGAYISRRSDGFLFTHLGLSAPPHPATVHPLRGELLLAPGDQLDFVHWCSPPDRYDFWVIVSYTR